MRLSTFPRTLTAALVLAALAVLFAGTIKAADLSVNCSDPRARLRTIKQALSLLPKGPNTIYVSGTCAENIVLQNVDHLTLTSKSVATINDASSGNDPMILISGSDRVTVQNLKFLGGAQGFVCTEFSSCNFINDTFSSSAFGSTYGVSKGKLENTIIEETTGGPGLQIRSSNVIIGPGVVLQGNSRQGLQIRFGSVTAALGITIQGNGSSGITVQENSVFRTNPGGGWGLLTITQNGGHGVELQSASVAYLGTDTSISGNGGHGVDLRDLSFVQFDSGATVSSTSQKVYCGPKNSATRGVALVASGTGETNCSEE